MKSKHKKEEIEKLLKELSAEEQAAITVDAMERVNWKPRKKRRVWRLLLSSGYFWIAVAVIILVLSLPFAAFWFLKGSTFTESKGSILQQIKAMNELTTAEAYTKVMIERQDNELFGQEIGIDLPGTKRQLLVVIPGSIRAGVDFSQVAEKDIMIDEEAKAATLTLPKVKFLGEPQIFFDQVEVYSYEGLFRSKADLKEGYELASEAKTLMQEEAQEQGVLQKAEENAKRSVSDMFSLVGYKVKVEFKE